jgi:DUF4097 and DUF4098 domain-containing protein YvlB
MTKQIRVAFLLILAGAVSAALSGCKGAGSPSDEQSTGSSTSGPVSIQKMGGDIDVANAPLGADLTTMGGNIHLGNVASHAKVKTMGGNVVIDQATGPVDATTMGGKITIASVNGSLKATTMAGDIKAHVVGASTSERDIDISSMAGTVELIVPKDFPMDVRITLAYTKDASREYQIVDSVGLTQQTSDDWDRSIGSPRKFIRAKGRIGSGLNQVTIKTINGDVILKQE